MHFIFVFSISLGKLFPDLREALQVTRGKFEELISPLLMRTISLVKLALAESGFKPNEIDEAIFSISKFCIICYTNISTFCFSNALNARKMFFRCLWLGALHVFLWSPNCS